MVQESTPVGANALRIDLDGGGAVAYAPPTPASPLSDYVLEAVVRTEGLQHDRTWISLAFLDDQQKLLETYDSTKVCQTQGWKKLRLGPVSPKDSRIRFAMIGLHLEPGIKADLKGTAFFDDLWLGHLPRLELSTGRRLNLYYDPKQIAVTCRASGFLEQGAAVTFCLEEVSGTTLATARLPLEEAGDAGARRASATWQPPIAGPGFYRLSAAMPGREAPAHQLATAVAVVEPYPVSERSEFGWSLAGGRQPLSWDELAELLGEAGVGRVKYPLWHDERTFARQIDELIRFYGHLDRRGIELVGVLVPPEEVWRTWGYRSPPTIAQTFLNEPKVWYPSVELVLARMAAQVRWWQLGADRDTSLRDYPDLGAKVAEIAGQLDRIGHGLHVGFSWSWADAFPRGPAGKAPWEFLCLSSGTPLTPTKLAEALAASRASGVQRWVTVEPAPRGQISVEARAANMIEQVVAAKTHGAEGIFVAEPFSTKRGLMNDDGTPGELLLPWRTAARLLGNAAYLGSIELPGASENHIFARQSDAVVVVRSELPKRETIFLGRNVRQVDPWGRPVPIAQQPEGQGIDVSPLPTFLVGVDRSIIGWHQGLSFDTSYLPSIPGVRHAVVVRMNNPLESKVTGTLRLLMPEGWSVEPQQIDVRMEGRQAWEHPLAITLAEQAVCGRQVVRAVLEIAGTPAVRLSIQRAIEAGLSGVSVELTARHEPSGELAIQQRVVNRGDNPVSLRCRLFVPGRRRMTAQVVSLGKGEDRQTYRLPNGKELLGKSLWLRLEEIGGPAVWNQRLIVPPEVPDVSPVQPVPSKQASQA